MLKTFLDWITGATTAPTPRPRRLTRADVATLTAKYGARMTAELLLAATR